MVLVESLAHVFSTGKSANDLANPPTGHGGFATPETAQLNEVLDDRRICQVGISDLANPRGPENMGERFDQDHERAAIQAGKHSGRAVTVHCASQHCKAA